MKYEEYAELINESISNVDKAPGNLQTVLKELKGDLTTMEAQTATIQEQEGRIKDLQDTNIKLFLGQTGKAPDPEEEEEKEPSTGKDAIDELVNILTTEKED